MSSSWTLQLPPQRPADEWRSGTIYDAAALQDRVTLTSVAGGNSVEASQGDHGATPWWRNPLVVVPAAAVIIGALIGPLPNWFSSDGEGPDSIASSSPGAGGGGRKSETGSSITVDELSTSDSTVDDTPHGSGDTASTEPTVSSLVEHVSIPPLNGLTVTEAQALLRSLDLVPSVVETRGPGPYDEVLAASPRAGMNVEAGSEVELAISIPPLRMPNFVGMDDADALDLIESYEMTASVDVVVDTEMVKDVVIEQHPPSGGSFADHTTIRINRHPTYSFLDELPVVDEQGTSTGTRKANTQSYDRALFSYRPMAPRCSPCSNFTSHEISFDVNREFDFLEGDLGLADRESASDAIVRFEIRDETGHAILVETVGFGETVSFSEPISGVLLLTLRASIEEGHAVAVFGDLRVASIPNE